MSHACTCTCTCTWNDIIMHMVMSAFEYAGPLHARKINKHVISHTKRDRREREKEREREREGEGKEREKGRGERERWKGRESTY